MRTLKLVLPAAILMGCTMLITTASYGKPEYAKKEGKTCTFCHAKMEGKDLMAKNLNAAGKYYAEHNHSLEGYK